jgi:hypothetical protein
LNLAQVFFFLIPFSGFRLFWWPFAAATILCSMA